MSRPPGPREQALRDMREARFEQQKKVEKGIRDAARAGAELLERVKATSERMKNKPARKGKKR